MKTNLFAVSPRLVAAALLCALPASLPGADPDLENAFRDALYAEEVKGDFEGALKAYREVGAKFESQRDMAAAALFREGECLRQLGRKDDAIAVYNSVLARYGDKGRIAALSREKLTALGQSLSTPPASDAVVGMPEDEAKELTRLKALAQNSPDLLGQGDPSPLRDAVEKGRTSVVAWLLERLPKQTPESLGGHLERASYFGHLKVCELLADAGASISGHGALHSALMQNRLAVARFLLGRKADVNEESTGDKLNLTWETGLQDTSRPSNFTKATPLMMAAGSASVPADFLGELLKAGADVGRVAEVRPLNRNIGTALGTTPRPEAEQHFTALGGAIAGGSPEKVRLLLEAAADVNQAASDLDATPLLVALAKAVEKDPGAATDPIVKIVLAAGAKWNARLTTGATALHIAARRGLGGWVAEAMKAGVDVNAVDSQGLTALHEGARRQSAAIVRALVAAGAKPNVVGDGVTPLGLGCVQSRDASALETVRALLEGGADPNLDGMEKRRPLNLALSDSFLSARRWPEAVMLLLEHGARPREAQIFGIPQPALPLDEAALEAFRAAWKAAHWRDNPRLAHAIWLSHSESALRAGLEPLFRAILCDESVAGPPTLRDVIRLDVLTFDWSKVTLTRRRAGKDEQIPVDVLALAGGSEPKDLPLEWGDVVEVPIATSPEAEARTGLKAWLEKDARADVRVELGRQRLVANANGTKGQVVRIEGLSMTDLGTVWRAAGLTEMLFTVRGVRTTQGDGTLGAVEQSGGVRHGDTVVLDAPQPQPKLSDQALRSGIWLCQDIDGPFWPVPSQQDVVGDPVPLGGLVVALLGPHPLPSPSFDWEKATVRVGVEEKEWQERKLLEAWPTLKLEPGTVVVLPPAERDSFEPPAELRDALTKALAVDWKLAIGKQPLVPSRWEPRFFRGKTEEGAWVWRDLDSAKTASPVVPALRDLLAAHPRAPDFRIEPNVPLTFGLGGGTDQLNASETGRWVNRESLVIHVDEATKTPQAPASNRPNPGQPGRQNRRRVILPPQTNGSQ